MTSAVGRLDQHMTKRKVWTDEHTTHAEFKAKDGHMAFADLSIVEAMEQLNEAGYETIASCSGISSDHHGGEDMPYLSVARPGGDDAAWVARIEAAGEAAGWTVHTGMYLLTVPDVSFYLPKTLSPANDRRALAEPAVVAAEQKLDEVMTYQRLHDNASYLAKQRGEDPFMDALHVRDAAQHEAFKKHGGEKAWSDSERMQKWDALTSELLKMSQTKQTTMYQHPGFREEAAELDVVKAELAKRHGRKLKLRQEELAVGGRTDFEAAARQLRKNERAQKKLQKFLGYKQRRRPRR